MPSFVRIAALSAGLYALAAAPASAFTVTFDEVGNCSGDCTGSQFTTDPTGTFSGKVLIYNLDANVGSGAVNIQDSNGTVSDTINFFSPSITANSEIIFYSYDNDGLKADVGTTVLFPGIFVGAIEDATGHFTFNPGAGIFYNGVSGVSVPLPATLPLFATGLGALGLLGWRRKKKATAA